MVALSSVSDEGQDRLRDLLRSMREGGLTRLKERFARAVSDGEIPDSIDRDALALFVQTVQGGMSILARDGATRADLEKVAQVAMDGWDARIDAGQHNPRRRR